MRLDGRPCSRTGCQCVECGWVSRENERGCTARLTYDEQVVVYCPECDDREFGGPAPGPV